MSVELLNTQTCEPYLRSRALLGDDSVTIDALSGGVSNIVLAVTGSTPALVIKQSLEKLNVADEWLAPQRRILSEAVALRLVAELTPGHTPRVVDVDSERMTLTMEYAGDGWVDWKTQLMDGNVRTDVAATLGRLLGRWHERTTAVDLPVELSNDPDAFEALRLEPYHATVAERLPELRDQVLAVAQRIRSTNECLVHGDFSPKNILVSPSGAVWVIDFEVAHRGDPVFDLAFLLSHLWIKSIHLPNQAGALDIAAAEFIAAYRAERATWGLDERYLLEQIGCLMLSRVYGKSPASYLTPADREEVARLGTALLLGDIEALEAFSNARERSIV